ncbi:hypothetical protein HMI54_001756 [Coelomomyces lativittatus]|nr:hypothetical protein HMI56_002872 [Coelomomyces lativittatus]KAJ1510252.1 hypothetical protein HMI54_001756 [Coelomomyces lativittatus]KAJ1514844.1 hypothetical protein HMI55_004293 [Coelomomyces lativittatus]
MLKFPLNSNAQQNVDNPLEHKPPSKSEVPTLSARESVENKKARDIVTAVQQQLGAVYQTKVNEIVSNLLTKVDDGATAKGNIKTFLTSKKSEIDEKIKKINSLQKRYEGSTKSKISKMTAEFNNIPETDVESIMGLDRKKFQIWNTTWYPELPKILSFNAKKEKHEKKINTLRNEANELIDSFAQMKTELEEKMNELKDWYLQELMKNSEAFGLDSKWVIRYSPSDST